MKTFEIEYTVFGLFLITAGLAMIVTYTLTNPWWRSHLGRMMVTYAAAEVIMSSLLFATVVFHMHPTWFRNFWFALQVIVGGTFWYQTFTIVRLHRRQP